MVSTQHETVSNQLSELIALQKAAIDLQQQQIKNSKKASAQRSREAQQSQDSSLFLWEMGGGFALLLIAVIIQLPIPFISNWMHSKLPVNPVYNQAIQEGDRIGGYEITSGFGDRVHPIHNEVRFHAGVDLGTPVGVQLYAPTDSTVECLNDPAGYGIYAIVSPSNMGGKEFLLGHLTDCRPGEQKAGRWIAITGNTGGSTGPHLHFEQHEDSKPVQPTTGYLEWFLTGRPPADNGAVQPAQTSGLDRFVESIKTQESGGDPSAQNIHSGALGLYQFMPDTIALYAPSCLGRIPSNDEFLADEQMQHQLMDCYTEDGMKQAEAIAEEAAREHGLDKDVVICRMMASFHYSGNPKLWDNDAPQSYAGGQYPSIAQYTMEVCQ